MGKEKKTTCAHRPSTTLIVTCYNRPEFLRNALMTAFRQSVPPTQIVVADDGSTEENFLVTRELRATTDIPLVHVWQTDAGFRLNRSRNNALAVATGDYVVFTDSDCFLGPRFIEDHLYAARRGRFVGGVRTHVLPARRDYILRTGDTRISVFSTGTTKRLHSLRSRLLSRFTSESGKPGESVTREHNPRILGANLAFWRDDALKVNGFDERYEGYGGDDLDFEIRLALAGLTWYRLKNLGCVFHFKHPELSRDLPAVHARLDEVVARGEFRIPDEFGLSRALQEGPERIEQ